MLRKGLLILLHIFPTVSGLAQTLISDTSFIVASEEMLYELYSNRMEDHIQLYNGSYYTQYSPTGKEHPYFIEDLEQGAIFYDGSLYRNEEMLYNTYTDKIIINDYYTVNLVQLVSEKIKYFILRGHTFVRLDDPSLKPGFYDLLVDGEIKLYVKRFKLFKQELTTYEVNNEFDEKTNFYIFRNGNYFPVKNKRTIRLVLSDFDKPLDQFIKKNNFVFRTNFEESASKIIEFCNAL